VLFIVTLWELMSGQSSTTTQESYSRLMSMALSGLVSRVRVDPQTHVVYATTSTGKKFQTTYPTGGTSSLSNTLTGEHVAVDIMKPATTSFWLSLVGNILPLLLIVFMLYFFFSQTQGGGNRVMQFGKSRAKLHTDDHNRVTFADVAGVEEEKQELQEVVDFLRYPKKYLELGARNTTVS
jgi:cell division protease FtsH